MTFTSVAIFGSLTIDDLVFADGTTRWCVPGGNAAYSALAARLFNGDVGIVAPIGSDYPLSFLQENIDLSRCRLLSHTLRNWGLYEADGRRHFISRSDSRDWASFCPQLADATTGRQKAAHIAAMPRHLALELCKELRAHGTLLLSLDLDDHDMIRPESLNETIELANLADFFLPSWQDATAIAPTDTPLESLRALRLLAPDPLIIAIKCGAEGVIAHIKGNAHFVRVPAVKVDVVDETGAGDSFCGAMLAGFVDHENPVESLICGTVAASFCIERLGFDGLLCATEASIGKRMEQIRSQVSYGVFGLEELPERKGMPYDRLAGRFNVNSTSTEL